jgi:DNA-directed RNA polymerase subunit RPC12/RpoP
MGRFRVTWIGEVTMEGRCRKCGTLYHTGALDESFDSRVCPYCGAALEIKNNGSCTFTGSSPFAAKAHRIDLTKTAPATIRAEPSNSNGINDKYILNRGAENPYVTGLQKAIEDFRNNA